MAYNKRVYTNSKENVTYEDFNRIETGIETNDKAITEQANKINVLNNRLGIYQVVALNGGDANTLKETLKRFVFNVTNIPSSSSYGMLEVYNLASGGFAPSSGGVIIQHYTDWYSGAMYSRTYRYQTSTSSYAWSDWRETATTTQIQAMIDANNA